MTKKKLLAVGLFATLAGLAVKAIVSRKKSQETYIDVLDGMWKSGDGSIVTLRADGTFSYTPSEKMEKMNVPVEGKYHYDPVSRSIILDGDILIPMPDFIAKIVKKPKTALYATISDNGDILRLGDFESIYGNPELLGEENIFYLV